MNESTWARIATLTGLLSVVLLAISTLLLNEYSYLPPPSEIQSLFAEGSTRVTAAAYLGLLAAFFLMWFAGSVRSWLRPLEGGTGRLSAVAFGGGVAAATLMIVAYGALYAGAQRSGPGDGLGLEQATTLFDVNQLMMSIAVPIGLALFFGATAVVSIRTGSLPAWLGWLTGLVAVGLVSPVAWIFVGIGAVWLALISVWLYVTWPTESEPAIEAG